MALFPHRHPQKDFFVLDISDVVPKDDTASMEHPIFSLSTKPDMRHLFYENGENSLKIIPSGVGLPTIFDKDILIFCVSQLINRKNKNLPVGSTVRFSARELSIATNRPIGGNHYKRLEQAFHRLIGTTFTTSIKTAGQKDTRVFNMVSEGGFVEREDSDRLDYCEVTLSDWMMRAIDAAEVVTISQDYFRLRRPLERRIYELARKHCGKQNKWQIGLAKLQLKTGSNAPLKRFRFNLREIIEEDHTPDYRIELTDADMVIFRPRKTTTKLSANLIIPEWAEEQARAIIREKGWDYHVIEREFKAFASKGGAKNVGAAFVGFCKKKKKLR